MVGPTYQESQNILSAKFDGHNNKFGKGWSPGSELMTGTNVFALPTLKVDLSYQPFTKDDIF